MLNRFKNSEVGFKLHSRLIWAVVLVAGFFMIRFYITRTAESDETRDTIIAYLETDDLYRALTGDPRKGSIVVDSLEVREILNMSEYSEVLVDLTYHTESQDGTFGPFDRTLRLSRRWGQWQVDQFQTMDINEMVIFHNKE